MARGPPTIKGIVMKKLMIVAAVLTAGVVCAQEAETKTENAEAEPVLEKSDDPIVWGSGNYGMYSGYQLYGSLVNSEPTMQGYVEVNFNIPGEIDYFGNLGYLGVGVWSNTDLTDKRRDSYGKAFNEWDYNVHYGKTFWFDDNDTWGLDYRASVVWYYYPHRRHHKMNGSTATTMDFNHSLALLNPYLVPFVDFVHEYHENNADLIQFGVKHAFKPCDTLTLTPSVTFVYRDHRYNWCFPTAGFTEFHNGGMATMKWMLDANYKLTEHFGLFAKVAYCSIIDSDLRDAADHGSGADYGQYKDFAWGGFGITVNF